MRAHKDRRAYLYAGGMVGIGSPLYTTRSEVPTSAWNAALNLLFPAQRSHVGFKPCRIRFPRDRTGARIYESMSTRSMQWPLSGLAVVTQQHAES